MVFGFNIWCQIFTCDIFQTATCTSVKSKDATPIPLGLNFGKIYFKWTPYRIEFEEETVIERLRARKMESCIRVVSSIYKEALEAYNHEVSKKLGCRRERDDKFHYEVKPEEVKL